MKYMKTKEWDEKCNSFEKAIKEWAAAKDSKSTDDYYKYGDTDRNASMDAYNAHYAANELLISTNPIVAEANYKVGDKVKIVQNLFGSVSSQHVDKNGTIEKVYDEDTYISGQTEYRIKLDDEIHTAIVGESDLKLVSNKIDDFLNKDEECKHENKYINQLSSTMKFWVCKDCKKDLGDA